MASTLTIPNWTSIAVAGAGICILYYILTALYSWNRLRAVPAASWSAHFSYLWLALQDHLLGTAVLGAS